MIELSITELYNYTMASKWTIKEELKHKSELNRLYVVQNKSLREVAKILGIKEQTVYSRLCRLGIKTQPERKKNYLKKRFDIKIPKSYTSDLAEFFGIMLGDGHISHFQTVVSLGTKEEEYAFYVKNLIKKIFGAFPKISIRKTEYRDVYLGSTEVTKWLKREGLVSNKVLLQVGIPKWIRSKNIFMERFIRGFFDTDGSVYGLKFGMQISFTNYSRPILESLHSMLFALGYKPSEISSNKIYLTRVSDVKRFFRKMCPKNQKHQKRFRDLSSTRRSYSGNYSRL